MCGTLSALLSMHNILLHKLPEVCCIFAELTVPAYYCFDRSKWCLWHISYFTKYVSFICEELHCPLPVCALLWCYYIAEILTVDYGVCRLPALPFSDETLLLLQLIHYCSTSTQCCCNFNMFISLLIIVKWPSAYKCVCVD